MTITWNQADKLANIIYRKIEKKCEQVVICGSIRRHASKVKDIDMVVLPIIERNVIQYDLWKNPVRHEERNLLLEFLDDRVAMDKLGLERINSGDKKVLIKMVKGTVVTELWLVDRANQLGFATLVRTGPPAVSKRIMRHALDLHWHITGYELHTHEKGGRPGRRTACTRGGDCLTVVDTDTELKAFAALGLAYPHPGARDLISIEALISDATDRRLSGVSRVDSLVG